MSRAVVTLERLREPAPVRAVEVEDGMRVVIDARFAPPTHYPPRRLRRARRARTRWALAGVAAVCVGWLAWVRSSQPR